MDALKRGTEIHVAVAKLWGDMNARERYYAARHWRRLDAWRQGLATVPQPDPLVAMSQHRRHYLLQRRTPQGRDLLHPYQAARIRARFA